VRLLLDQNLSPGLIDLLADLYPGSQHVRNVGLGAANDEQVWSYAAREGLAIVSKDTDFSHACCDSITPTSSRSISTRKGRSWRWADLSPKIACDCEAIGRERRRESRVVLPIIPGEAST
jgi:uncharacterized protein DUF5615